MLLCAGILGRYYTDYHDVDEDEVTGVIYGERWWHGSEIGIAHREMHLDQTGLVEYVASKQDKYSLHNTTFPMLCYKKVH